MDNCIICNVRGNDLVLNGLEMKKCPRCHLIWRSRFGLPHDYYQNLSTNQSSLKLGQRYQNSLDRIKLFKKYSDLNDLCDVGTGEGVFLKALKDHGYKNICGLEPALENQAYARDNDLDLIKGTLADLPKLIRNRQVKTISLFHVIEHLENPLASLQEIHELMTPSSQLIIETPNIDGYSFKKSNYQHELVYFEHLFYFDIKNLPQLLKKIGFKIVASGRRDFNQNHLTISEILFRLGLKNKKKSDNLLNKLSVQSETSRSAEEGKLNILKRLIVAYGCWLVRALGRQDYQWIIVSK